MNYTQSDSTRIAGLTRSIRARYRRISERRDAQHLIDIGFNQRQASELMLISLTHLKHLLQSTEQDDHEYLEMLWNELHHARQHRTHREELEVAPCQT